MYSVPQNRRRTALGLPDLATFFALTALTFPSLMMFEYQGQMIFPHYIALVIAIPILFAVRPTAILSCIIPLLIIFMSSMLNANEFSFGIAMFHAFSFISIAFLSSSRIGSVLKFAKSALLVYAWGIFALQILAFLGYGSFIEQFLVQKEGIAGTRISGFATEPAYAGLIMLILGRFILSIDPNWMSPRRLAFVLGAMVASLSLFSLLAAILLLALYVGRSGRIRTLVGVFFGGVVLVLIVASTDFFISRIEALNFSAGALGLGSGTIRLLPYIYLSDILRGDVWPLIWGAGAGQFEPQFFLNVGRYHTNNETLTAHMAAAIYDYGLPIVLWVIYSFNRFASPIVRAIYLVMAILVILNTGLGTYLFILYGVFSLLERNWHSRLTGGRKISTPAREVR